MGVGTGSGTGDAVPTVNAPPTRAALERALRDGEFVLHYQPKVCLSSGRIVGAEALVRWNDGADVISPDEFLPIAERIGLLHDITLGLLDQVVAAAVALRVTCAGLALSMNVAPDDLAANVISTRIGERLAAGDIAPADLEIEITESAVMGNVEKVRDDLERLRSLGIKVLMDDFGTGYSSIDRLSQLPFGSLKLDQGVVRRMGTSRRSLDVVKASISMARELRMTAIAEGVESAGTYDFLIANGCEEAQGYWIARPMSLEDLRGFVADPREFAGSQVGRVHHAVLNLLQFRKSLVDALFCSRGGRVPALDSIIDPRLGGDVADSAVGAWYFGSGRQLAGRASYRAIEVPLVRLHADGNRLLERLAEGRPLDGDVSLADLDAQVVQLVALMHALERELVDDHAHA